MYNVNRTVKIMNRDTFFSISRSVIKYLHASVTKCSTDYLELHLLQIL